MTHARLLSKTVLTISFLMTTAQYRLVLVVHRYRERLKSSICLLLAQKAAERSVSTAIAPSSLAFKATIVILAVLFKLLVGRLVLLKLMVNLFSVYVELTKLVHVINHLVTYFHSFPCLFKCVFVSVNLREDSTVLKLQFSNHEHFSHSVTNALLLEIQKCKRHVIKGMFNTLSTFFQQLHLLVTQSHVMEHNEDVVDVSFTG
jgi:hypothetical protein